MQEYLKSQPLESILANDATVEIANFADQVHGASYKIAQCATLYSRGYHCGIIPVDSGMVTKLAPCLGLDLPKGTIAHERMRLYLQDIAVHYAPQIKEFTKTSILPFSTTRHQLGPSTSYSSISNVPFSTDLTHNYARNVRYAQPS